jgi:hypothetical protein
VVVASRSKAAAPSSRQRVSFRNDLFNYIASFRDATTTTYPTHQQVIRYPCTQAWGKKEKETLLPMGSDSRRHCQSAVNLSASSPPIK